MSQSDNNNLEDFKKGIDSLYKTLESLVKYSDIPKNGLSGDQIHGGNYTGFKSTGIEDLASKSVIVVKDDGLYVNQIHTPVITGNVTLNGNFRVSGSLTWDNQALKDEIVNIAVEKSKENVAIVDYRSIPLRGLSGDHINGGKINNFESTGIKDKSSKHTQLVITDNGILADKITTSTIDITDFSLEKGKINHLESLSIKAKLIETETFISDTRIERSEPLRFYPSEGGSIINQGLLWVKEGEPTKQFVLHPQGFYSSESIDIQRDKDYKIGGIPIISKERLGDSVSESKLKKVGTLQNLRTSGSLVIDEFIYYNSISNRLGFGIEEPNATLDIASLNNDFIIDVEDTSTKIGNFSSTPLNIITDNVPRIQISSTGSSIVIGSNIESKTVIQGKLGVNVNSPDCDIVTSGPVKFEDKKFSVGTHAPKTGIWKKGDIVWNQNPAPTGWVGWICIREGSPGEWRSFGSISK